jgi:RNA polymerase sigma factor (sigma-70 family)
VDVVNAALGRMLPNVLGAGMEVHMDSKLQEDKALHLARAVKLVQAGDVNAYEGLYAACDEALRAFIGRRYGHLGQDFVEEVAIRTHEFAFSHINEYSSDRGASFKTWLFWQSRAIAKHVCREWYGRRFVHFDQAQHGAYAVSATGPIDIYEEKRLWRVLREETEALPGSERETVMLHDIEARSHPEMARVSGLTYEQVRYRRRLVLKRLRKRLKERGVRPVPIDTTPVPIWLGKNNTDPNDDYTTSVTAVLPTEPPTLVGAAAKEEGEE